MSATVDPDLVMKLGKFGVADATACFNCGNCAALCSLSTEGVPFPRKVLRYLQLGLSDKLLQSPEPWLCYYCGDCSETCPRQANPGEVMMGLRRYLTARYDWTGISRRFYTSTRFEVLAILLPKAAKKLYFDVIPKTLDEYWQHVEKYPSQDGAKALDNPVWHIHGGNPPAATPPVSFAMLLTLVNAVGGDPDVLKGFIRKYRPAASPEALAAADALTVYAARYYKEFVEPNKKYRPPSEVERAALSMLAQKLRAIGDGADEDAYHTATFDTGKANGYEKNLRDWFAAIYEIVFGQTEGPRMGPFTKIYGASATAKLIENALAR